MCRAKLNLSPHRETHTTLYQPILAFFLGLVAIVGAYYLALPGYWLFDDAPNLEGLSKITDFTSWLEFVVSGHAGPTGRPLALATFALQNNAWPEQPGAMLAVNVAIHASATVSVFFLALGLIRVRGYFPTKLNASLWAATAIALTWGSSPFLATTNLMIIQRMASLAGLFAFTGLSFFVWSHLVNQSRRLLVATLLIVGLGLFTLLATLSKENGALLPLLAIVTLYLWIPKEKRHKTFFTQSIILVLAILPSILTVLYLGKYALEALGTSSSGFRDFTVADRLLTQPNLLFDYLKNLILPRASSVTPFTDSVIPARGLFSPPATAVSIVSWIALIAFSIHYRKSFPYILFGIAFFLTGHIIESSAINLELYFAHRNYVPAFGAYFALVFLIYHALATHQVLLKAAAISYLLIFYIILAQTAINWQDVETTAQRWLTRNPKSVRAAQFVANRFFSHGETDGALNVLKNSAEQNPNNAMLLLQSKLICTGTELEFAADFDELLNKLGQTSFDRGVGAELARIAKTGVTNYCKHLTLSDINAAANELLKNPKYAVSSVVKSQLLIAKGYSYAERGMLLPGAAFFIQAYQEEPNLDILFTAASLLSNAGKSNEAMQLIEFSRQEAPTDLLNNYLWNKRLDSYSYLIEASDTIKKHEHNNNGEQSG